MSAGLRGCYLPPGLPLVLLACGGPQFGQLAGFGEAVENERAPSGLWSAVLLGATVRTRGSGWFLQGGLEGGPVLVRQAFGVTVDGEFNESFRSYPWVFSTFAGFGWRSR